MRSPLLRLLVNHSWQTCCYQMLLTSPVSDWHKKVPTSTLGPKPGLQDRAACPEVYDSVLHPSVFSPLRRWNADAHELVRQLVRVRALRTPPALRAAASSAAVQHAVGGTALGASWLFPRSATNSAAGPRPRPRACGAGRAESLPAPVSGAFTVALVRLEEKKKIQVQPHTSYRHMQQHTGRPDRLKGLPVTLRCGRRKPRTS